MIKNPIKTSSANKPKGHPAGTNKEKILISVFLYLI